MVQINSLKLGTETEDGSTGSRRELYGVVITTWLVDSIAIRESIQESVQDSIIIYRYLRTDGKVSICQCQK